MSPWVDDPKTGTSRYEPPPAPAKPKQLRLQDMEEWKDDPAYVQVEDTANDGNDGFIPPSKKEPAWYGTPKHDE